MLHYQLEGSGKPLLLIHGWGVTYPIWQNLAPLLTPYFQLIMIELPGIGKSPNVLPNQPYYPACADAIEELRKELGIEQWAILSYSSGTRAAEAYAQRYPEHITHIIFLCPIYLPNWCSLAVYLLDVTRPPQIFKNWLLSDWRLYSLVVTLGFNGQRHAYTQLWKKEIEMQSLDTLVRTLCELPGKGRTPFISTTIATLFIWGRRDILTARPRRLRTNDIVLPTNHGAPMLAAKHIAEVAIPFLKDGKIPSIEHTRQERRLWRKRIQKNQRLLKLMRQITRQNILRKQHHTQEEKSPE